MPRTHPCCLSNRQAGAVMTDLEITKACAEAMGLSHEWDSLDRVFLIGTCDEHSPHPKLWELYDPLHDDAQAMALVKHLKLEIRYYNGECAWGVFPANQVAGSYQYKDLNRAICECVYKLHKAETT